MSKVKPFDSRELPESHQQYIATPIEMAQIVDACLRQTVVGIGHSKDWLPNVLNSIEGINGIVYGDKVKLKKLPTQIKGELVTT